MSSRKCNTDPTSKFYAVRDFQSPLIAEIVLASREYIFFSDYQTFSFFLTFAFWIQAHNTRSFGGTLNQTFYDKYLTNPF